MLKFKVGDVVVCKLGGPKMTVSEIYDGGVMLDGPINYGCQWFNKEDSLCHGLFKEVLLEAVDG